MNRILAFLLCLLAAPLWAQTGNGVVLLTGGTHTFAPTPVDSTDSFSFQLVNEVGVEQTVFFGSLDAPFSLESDAPQDVPSLDTIDVTIHFNPTELGDYQDTLSIIGGVFGNAEIMLSGEGVQVILNWSSDALVFDTTAIGQTSSLDIDITNTGNGTAVLEAMDDPSGQFTVEFVNPYTPPTPDTCFTDGDLAYHEYYLTVDLGPDPDNTYWYIDDPYYGYSYGGSYGEEAEEVVVCLPANGSDAGGYVTYINLENGNGASASLTLTDVYGNENTVELYDGEYGTYPEFFLELGPAPSGPPFTPGLIPEGQNTTARVSFSPTTAGLSNGTVLFTTNSPNTPQFDVACEGFGLAEAGGEYCDITWEQINSPYTLIADVIIPDSCSLTVEPGTVVNLNGFDLIVHGELNCTGTLTHPITFENGEIRLTSQQPTQLSYVHVNNEIPESTPYEVVYFNNFESQAGQYDLDCYDYGTNQYNTGSSDGGNYGCNSFYRDQNDSWSNQNNSGDYFLNWYSYYYEGELYLSQPIYASYSGSYDISFTFETSRFERYCHLTLDIWKEGEWIEAWSSQDDIEYNSELTYIAKGTANYEAGEEIVFRLKSHIYSTSNDYNEMYVYLDNLKVERSLRTDSEAEWSIESDYDNFSAAYSGNSWWTDFSFTNDTIRIISNNQDNSYSWNTISFSDAPITVPEDGWYLIEYDHQTNQASSYCYWQTYYYVNYSQYPLDYHDTQYGTSAGTNTYPWYTTTIQSYSYLNAGDRIDFGGYVYSYSSGYEVDFEMANFRIYQVGSSLIQIYDESIRTENDLTLTSCNTGGVYVNGNLNAQQCSMNHLEASGNISLADCQISGGPDGVCALGSNALVQIENTSVSNSAENGVRVQSGSVTASNSSLINNGNAGLLAGSGTSVTLTNTTIRGNDLAGLEQGPEGQTSIVNSVISGNGIGIETASSLDIDHGSIGLNAMEGILNTGSAHTNLTNTILWGNNTGNGEPTQMTLTGWGQGEYNLIQGGLSDCNAGCMWGDGMLDDNPHFADVDLSLEAYSPAIDAGTPWETDAHMPFGLGGLRADMGAYGGAMNAGWGGTPAPSGSAALNGVTDSPQDQGNFVGLEFGASAFDNSLLPDNVTHYAFWRHYDPTGQTISALDDGNWELLGTMPAQGFGGYAYQAATLGNTNDTGPFSSCYTVVAHTADEDTYWYSNVLCGESIDNLAPDAPDLNGMVLEDGGAQVSWADPNIEDYGYTRIISDSGFEAEISADTLVVDLDALPGSTVTYTATHFDVNGNESDPSDITLVIGATFDVIALQAGWNLISLDRAPANASISALFADLIPGNLQYVTGFDEGVSFHDPSGLPFLNTLDALSPGYGYWVKVQENDTLRAPGAPLGGGYLPALDAGWNLVAYTAEAPLAPALFFGELIANEELVYVTGFDGGVEVFDPYGLPFLNTLSELQNGFGYWVKTDADYEGMAVDGAAKATPNPNYIILNGTSNLDAHAGQTVAVVTAEGDVVAEMAILEGGHLMTTAVYGAGPSGLDGIAVGEPLYLEFAGERTEAVAAWTGDMAHVKLDVQFDGPAFSVFPNPATDWIDVRFDLTESGNATVEVLDAAGRLVMSQPLGLLLDGEQQVGVSTADLVPGTYQVRLVVDGRTVHTTTLQRIR